MESKDRNGFGQSFRHELIQGQIPRSGRARPAACEPSAQQLRRRGYLNQRAWLETLELHSEPLIEAKLLKPARDGRLLIAAQQRVAQLDPPYKTHGGDIPTIRARTTLIDPFALRSHLIVASRLSGSQQSECACLGR